MKAKDLFIIILKVFGIYLIKDVLISIPPILYTFHQLIDASADVAFFSLFVALLTFGLYFGIVYILLFQPAWLVSRLKLTANLSEEPLVTNIHRSSVYTIAIIVSGIIILTFSIPHLIQNFYLWSQYMDSRNSLLGSDYFDYKLLIIPLSEVLIGSLFLGNQRTIVNFIESRRRQSTGG